MQFAFRVPENPIFRVVMLASILNGVTMTAVDVLVPIIWQRKFGAVRPKVKKPPIEWITVVLVILISGTSILLLEFSITVTIGYCYRLTPWLSFVPRQLGDDS